MEFQGKPHIIVVDYYSYYPEIWTMSQKTGDSVIAALKSIFAVHSIPLEVMADNITFNSLAVNRFEEQWNFTITTSGPHRHTANGLAERYVQTIKPFIKKAMDSGEDIDKALLAYKQT